MPNRPSRPSCLSCLAIAACPNPHLPPPRRASAPHLPSVQAERFVVYDSTLAADPVTAVDPSVAVDPAAQAPEADQSPAAAAAAAAAAPSPAVAVAAAPPLCIGMACSAFAIIECVPPGDAPCQPDAGQNIGQNNSGEPRPPACALLMSLHSCCSTPALLSH
jgi:hypothetical protein